MRLPFVASRLWRKGIRACACGKYASPQGTPWLWQCQEHTHQTHIIETAEQHIQTFTMKASLWQSI